MSFHDQKKGLYKLFTFVKPHRSLSKILFDKLMRKAKCLPYVFYSASPRMDLVA